MLPPVENPLVLIKLENLKEKYGTPSYDKDKLKGDRYAMETNTMTLLPEKATMNPQISSTIVICTPDPSQTFGPSLGTLTRLMLMVVKSTCILQLVMPGQA